MIIIRQIKYIIGRTICWYMGLSKEDIETLTTHLNTKEANSQ